MTMQIGDRVMLLNSGGYSGGYRAGMLGTVTGVPVFGVVRVFVEGIDQSKYGNNLNFRVGSEVVLYAAAPATETMLRELLEAARSLLNTEEVHRGRYPDDETYYTFEKWAIQDLEHAVQATAALLGEVPHG